MNKENTKIRVLAVSNMLRRGQRITARQIQDELERKYGITADRKTIYDDIQAVNRFIPVEGIGGRNGGFEVVDVYGRC